jgi:hypothetical protein
VVLGAAVAAAAIAGSLSLSRKTILRVPKKLGDEDEEVIRTWGRLSTVFHKRKRPRHRKAQERRVKGDGSIF